MLAIQSAVKWFKSLSNGLKVVIVVVCVVVAILASSAVSVIATLVFVIGIVALVVQALRRRPLRRWGIVTASALGLAIVFGGISSTLTGTSNPPQESKQESAVAEKQTEEEPAAAAAVEEKAEEEPAAAREAKTKAEPEPAKSEKKRAA